MFKQELHKIYCFRDIYCLNDYCQVFSSTVELISVDWKYLYYLI